MGTLYFGDNLEVLRHYIKDKAAVPRLSGRRVPCERLPDAFRFGIPLVPFQPEQKATFPV
jgi:hypothetical protein